METLPPLAPPKATPQPDISPARKAQIMETAREFEAAFVAQMLKHSGMTDALTGKSGFGAEAFSGMLTEQYASELIENGGFGLAEGIYQQLLAKETRHGTDAAL